MRRTVAVESENEASARSASVTLSPCCPYQPRRSVAPHQSSRRSMLPSPENGRLGLRTCPFEAIWVHLLYGPATRSPPFSDGFVNRLQEVQFPFFLLFKLRGLDFYPGGTLTHCSCQPSLDAHFPGVISHMADC